MFNRRDFIGWARMLIEAQDILDAGERAKSEVAATRQQIEAAGQKLAEMKDAHQQAIAEFGTARASHAAEMERLQAEREAVQNGLEADKVARAVSHSAGLEQIRQDHASVRNELGAQVDALRQTRDALKTEVANLRRFKDELTRDIEAVAAKFAVPVK